MFKLLKPKEKSFRKKLNAICDIEQSLRFCLFLELFWEYEKKLNQQVSGTLAVQVSNHLMGDDFSKVYNSLAQEAQKRIDSIKDIIEVKVAEAMTKNQAIRELIIRHIMTTSLIYHCLFDKSWFDKLEMNNRDKLIREYGSDGDEFPDVINYDKYMTCALNFIHTRQQLYEQKKH